MNEISEEELQRRIEAGEHITGKNAWAYRKVFNALEQAPDFSLPANFADTVMTRIESKQESPKEFVLIAGSILFFVVAAIVVYLSLDLRFSLNAFELLTDFSAFMFIKNYLELFVFGIAFIILLQWFDRRFIRPSRHANDLDF